MKTFIISDTHFGHENIISYCNRPFETVEQMNDEMIKRWNSVVGKEDIVYHLGDFALGNKESIKNYKNKLNGRIRLVLGNHDHLRFNTYYELGFDRVYDRPIILEDNYILSHSPKFTVTSDPFLFSCFYNIFGHVHTSELYDTCTKHSFCACCERLNYTPIEFDKIKKLIKERTIKC